MRVSKKKNPERIFGLLARLHSQSSVRLQRIRYWVFWLTPNVKYYYKKTIFSARCQDIFMPWKPTLLTIVKFRWRTNFLRAWHKWSKSRLTSKADIYVSVSYLLRFNKSASMSHSRKKIWVCFGLENVPAHSNAESVVINQATLKIISLSWKHDASQDEWDEENEECKAKKKNMENKLLIKIWIWDCEKDCDQKPHFKYFNKVVKSVQMNWLRNALTVGRTHGQGTISHVNPSFEYLHYSLSKRGRVRKRVGRERGNGRVNGLPTGRCEAKNRDNRPQILFMH